jgi:hypothetical protein
LIGVIDRAAEAGRPTSWKELIEKNPLSPSPLLTGLLAGLTLALPPSPVDSFFSSRFAALLIVEIGVPLDVAPFDDAVMSSSSVVLLLPEFQEAVSGDLLTLGTKLCRFRVNSVTDVLTRLGDLLSLC